MNSKLISIVLQFALIGTLSATTPADSARKPDINAYITKLDSPAAPEREAAARQLGNMGTAAKPAQEKLVAALNDKDDSVRVMAAYALKRLGYEPAKVLPVFMDCLKAQTPAVRNTAAMELGGYADQLSAQQKKRAITALLPVVGKDTDVTTRANAILSLAHLGAHEKYMLDALLKGLKDEAEPVRAASAYTISVTCAKAKKTVPALEALLSDKSVEVRETAAVSLGRLGKKAKSALKALNALASDSEARVREAAKAAADKITNAKS